MQRIDINCDTGEGIGNDHLIMPYINSANIACGVHAGDDETMRRTIKLCLKYNVAIGAHPSYPDRENFGRKEMPLSPEQVYDIMVEQVKSLQSIAQEYKAAVHHVKPHGALYNVAAKNIHIAEAIARAVRDVDEDMEIYGLSGSYLISEGKKLGLKTRSEVFADRTYSDNGSLTPRTNKAALIEDENKAVQQVMQMMKRGTVTSVNGKEIPIVAETVCIHGDGKNALEIAKALKDMIKSMQ